MNSRWSLCFIFSVLSLVVACSALAERSKVRVGISVPLSGEAAAYGTDIKNSLVAP